MGIQIRKKNKGLEIQRYLRRIDPKVDVIPFITMKFLSDKQEEYKDNLEEFQEQYGFTFRDYELLSNIIKKHDEEDESYVSDINSAFNALKYSTNKDVKEIYNEVSDENINKNTLDDILSILEIEKDIIQLYKYVNYVQNNMEMNDYDSVKPPLIELLAKIINSSHKAKNVYDPSCRDAQTITALKDFEHATVYEEDETYYSHIKQNMLINNIPLDKISSYNRKIVVDDTDTLYDTIISIPHLIRGRQRLNPEEFTESLAKYHTKNPKELYLINLIEHLDDNGLLITTTSQDLLVKKDAYELRKCLIENNLLDSVIEYETGFRTRDITILIINKNKKTEDFLFMKPKQLLPGLVLPETEEQILESYKNREIIPKFSNIITREEIIKNEYNLNPKRYVYTLDYEQKTIEEILNQQEKYKTEIKSLDEEIGQLLDKLNE